MHTCWIRGFIKTSLNNLLAFHSYLIGHFTSVSHTKKKILKIYLWQIYLDISLEKNYFTLNKSLFKYGEIKFYSWQINHLFHFFTINEIYFTKMYISSSQSNFFIILCNKYRRKCCNICFQIFRLFFSIISHVRIWTKYI